MDEIEYWNKRYSKGINSGYGSYGEFLKQKIKLLKENVHDISSIVEIGCGDFNFGQHILELYPDADYLGLDISKEIVKYNQTVWPEYEFKTISKVDTYPPADLVLCVDVLFHVYEDKDVQGILKNLKKAWKKYLVLTAYEYDKENDNPNVKLRKFDPSYFGTPICKEIVEADGSMFLYIFKK